MVIESEKNNPTKRYQYDIHTQLPTPICVLPITVMQNGDTAYNTWYSVPKTSTRECIRQGTERGIVFTTATNKDIMIYN